jgi:zinc transport system substrate-binding protein
MKRLTILFILLSFVFGCLPESKKTEKPVVSVSILPLMFFVGEIAGDLVEINVVVPPGAGPENFEPGPKEIQALSASLMLFHFNLFDVEKQVISRMETATRKVPMNDVSRDVALIKEDHQPEEGENTHGHAGGVDPHIWSSVKNARIIARNVEAGLAGLFPEHKDKFAENLKKLLREIDELDVYAKEKFSKAKRKSFIIFHPALAYYAAEYGLTQLALEQEGKSPSALYMKQLVDLARKENIKTVFLQNQFDENNMNAFAREIGAKLEKLDPLDGNWLRNMVLMTDQIAISLNE